MRVTIDSITSQALKIFDIGQGSCTGVTSGVSPVAEDNESSTSAYSAYMVDGGYLPR
jgi:hypothetical protein